MSNSRTKLIDAHAYLGRYPSLPVGTSAATDLLARMDRLGITDALVCHTHSWLHDPATGNALILDEIADQPRLMPCWTLLPDLCGEVPRPELFVADANAAGVVAVRAYPADHGYELNGADAFRVLAALADATIPLLIDSQQALWHEIESTARTHPSLNIIVTQTGYRILRKAAGVLSRCSNVLLDLSNLATHCGLEWLVARFGPQRFIFGTGAPMRDPAEAITRLLWSELDDHDVEQIASRNIAHLLPARATS